jgi:integrase
MPTNLTRRLDDDAVAKLPLARARDYVVRDASLARFAVRVSKKHRTFLIQAERPARFGDRKTHVVRLGRHPMVTVAEARNKAVALLGRIDSGLEPEGNAVAPVVRQTTVGPAFVAFKESMRRRECSERTIKEYDRWYRLHLSQWEDTPLLTLADRPSLAKEAHDVVTRNSGPVEANHAMRLLRAIHRHAAKADTKLSAEGHCCRAVEWNPEKRADIAIPFAQMPKWWKQVLALREANPLRAAFHVLCVFTGMRPGELRAVRWSYLDLKKRVLRLPTSKTGVEITVPLTLPMVSELRRARDAGSKLYPGSEFVFPADSASGHMERHTEPKTVLSHCGNSGRHTHRTVAAAIGIDELTSRLLLGHEPRLHHRRRARGHFA